LFFPALVLRLHAASSGEIGEISVVRFSVVAGHAVGEYISQTVSAMRSRILFASLMAAAVALGSQPVAPAQRGQTDWSRPFPPHKVIGNVYFAGSEQLASFLITTPEGHILINSGFETTVPVIRAAVESLGFRFADIRILLGSHAHGDHMEGDALIKELTGARVMAMEQDVPALQNMRPGNKPHQIDRVLKDGDTVNLGGATLSAHLTAGHTKGCTTWSLKVQEGGRSYDVVIVCSVGVNPGVALVNNKDYPQIAEDYIRSFKALRGLPSDVFLGPHGSFYRMTEKHAQLEKGGANPFVDPKGLGNYLDVQEKAFYTRLQEQKAAAK
jgi:metallo-beta-lactamase class B